MYGDTVVRMLTTQYRMNKNIMEWSSNALYSGRVVAGAEVAEHRLCDIPGVERSELTETVLLLVDTAGCQMQEFSTSDGVSKGKIYLVDNNKDPFLHKISTINLITNFKQNIIEDFF